MGTKEQAVDGEREKRFKKDVEIHRAITGDSWSTSDAHQCGVDGNRAKVTGSTYRRVGATTATVGASRRRSFELTTPMGS
jgi:hypothetical protein